jgi:hypothetical protein
MSRRVLFFVLTFLVCTSAATGLGLWYHTPAKEVLPSPPAPEATPPPPFAGAPADTETAAPPQLPETDPPAGLPIVAWGRRNHFPTIRKPRFLTADQGDMLLAMDEPVLGVVLGGEPRAYPTNQLNDHEMVLDEVSSTPILVTY